MRRHQKGLATVEFAVAGTAVLIVLFSCLEISRALYVWNTLGEATRRAARLGAVCPPNHASVLAAALLNDPGGSTDSGIIKNLSTANVSVTYTDANGDTTATLSDMAYVTVSITGFQHTLMIPFITQTLTVPPFSTTVPRESLGYVPDTDSYACAGG